MRKFIMDKYNLIAFAIGLIPTILLYLFPPDAAVPFWAFSIVLFFLLIAIWMCAKLWLESKNDKAVPTILEVVCKDRQGLLLDISAALSTTNTFVQIGRAHV